VVGWVDLASAEVEAPLAKLKERSDGRYLVGIPHLVYDEPDPEWLLREDVKRGLRADL
jgi:L-fuconolactonase